MLTSVCSDFGQASVLPRIAPTYSPHLPRLFLCWRREKSITILDDQRFDVLR